MDKYLQDEVAELFGVKLTTLRQWRTSMSEGTDLYLPAHRDKKTSTSYYTLDDLTAFCLKNPKYGNMFMRPIADEYVGGALPAAMALQIAGHLRDLNKPVVSTNNDTVPMGLLAGAQTP